MIMMNQMVKINVELEMNNEGDGDGGGGGDVLEMVFLYQDL